MFSVPWLCVKYHEKDFAFSKIKFLFQVEAVWVACHQSAQVLACCSLLALLVKNRESHTKWDQVLAVTGCSPNLRHLMRVSVARENQKVQIFLIKYGCLSFLNVQDFHKIKLVLIIEILMEHSI
jgi:allantoicase